MPVILLFAIAAALAGCDKRSESQAQQTPSPPVAAADLPAAEPAASDPVPAPTTRPAATQPDVVGRPICVVTLNILHAQMKSEQQIAAAIAVHRPQVVLLQESHEKEAARVARALRMHIADTRALPEDRPRLETAVLAAAPLRKVRILRSDRRPFAVMAETTLDGRSVTLVSVHQQSTHPGTVREMATRTTQRIAETTLLVEALGRVEGTVIMAGDFNEGPDTPSMLRIQQRMDLAFAKAGRGSPITFPGFAAGIRIDHIYYTRDLHAADCFVDPAAVSDHRMVVATLRFLRQEPGDE